jgi:hypothetical protein
MKVIVSKSDIDGYRFELRKKIGVVADKYTDYEIAMLLANDTDVLHSYIEKVEVEE